MSATNEGTAPKNYAIRQMIERREGKLVPREALLEVTQRCNLRCFHCCLDLPHREIEPPELSFSEVTDILDQLFEAGVLALTFSGGEPLCRPDIFEIMDYAKERGFFFGLKTNGTLLTEAMTYRLKDLGITSVHVSLYGATPTTHEHVTGVVDSFDRAIRAVETLHRSKIRVGIRTSIMKCNFEEDKAIGDLASRLGATYHHDPLIFPKLGQPGSADGLRIDDEQLREFICQHDWVYNIDETTKDLSRHLICAGGKTRCAISPQGEVFPCASWRIPLGDLRQHRFKDIWQGEAAARIRAIKVSDLPVCASCELVYYCNRCPGLVHAENSGISGPSSENCRLARATKGVIDGKKQENLRKPGYRVGTT